MILILPHVEGNLEDEPVRIQYPPPNRRLRGMIGIGIKGRRNGPFGVNGNGPIARTRPSPQPRRRQRTG